MDLPRTPAKGQASSRNSSTKRFENRANPFIIKRNQSNIPVETKPEPKGRNPISILQSLPKKLKKNDPKLYSEELNIPKQPSTNQDFHSSVLLKRTTIDKKQEVDWSQNALFSSQIMSNSTKRQAFKIHFNKSRPPTPEPTPCNSLSESRERLRFSKDKSPPRLSKEPVNAKYYLDGLNTKHPKHNCYRTHILKSHYELLCLGSSVFQQVGPKKYFPPALRSHKHILMLDLDETLVHCCNFDPLESATAHHTTSYIDDQNRCIQVKFNIRPHLKEFLEQVSQHFDVGIYTAADKHYAMSMVNYIDPKGLYFKHFLFREHTAKLETSYSAKDLRKVVPVEELKNILLVDNTASCFLPQLDNGVPIINFTTDHSDTELRKLLPFLLQLKAADNIQAILSHYFKLKQFELYSSTEGLLKALTNS